MPSDSLTVAEPERTLTVRGRVLDPDGKPFAGAKVYAYRPDPAGTGLSSPTGPPAPDAISDRRRTVPVRDPRPGIQTSAGPGELEPPDRRGPGPRIRAGLGLVHHGRRRPGT